MAPGATSVLRSFTAPTARDRRRICTIVEAMLPVEEIGVTPTPREVPLERFVEDFVHQAPLEVGIGLRLATWIVWLAPPFALRRLRTFGGCTKAERFAVLGRLAASETYVLREMPVLLKMVACLGYCGIPDVQERLGIPLGDASPPAWLGPHEPTTTPRIATNAAVPAAASHADVRS